MSGANEKRMFGGASERAIGILQDMPRHKYIESISTTTGNTVQFNYLDTFGGSTVGSLLVTYDGTDKTNFLSAERLV